ncbi:OmpA family protein [Puia sp. P3]|uniref:OmpA family protein n=1 Tax=Puia sp. P3 TaxID=3423952 RepID=UPI003D669286
MRVLVCLAVFIGTSLSVSAQGRSRDSLTVYFGFSRHDLRAEEVSRLDSFVRRVNASTDTVYIYGYTDTVGTVEYNQGLSLRRAQQVAARVGTLPGLVVAGLGEGGQVDGGDSVNRRVVVVRSYPSVVRDAAAARDTGAVKGAGDTAAGQPDSIITLRDINFYEDQAILTESSRMYLPRYLLLLREYKTDYIEVDGYVNFTVPVTEPGDPLFKLSVKRAKLIYDILIEEGFDPSHLSYKGMGNKRSRFAHPATRGGDARQYEGGGTHIPPATGVGPAILLNAKT